MHIFGFSSSEWLCHIILLPAECESSVCSSSTQHQVFSVFFILAILVYVQQYYIMVLIFISLMTNDVEHFFLHAYYPLLQSTCFGYFANFLLYSAFSLLIYRSSYIFWICLFFMWYKYLPLCGLSFYYIAMLFSSFSKYSSLILLQYKCFGWCSLCPI